MAAKNPYWLNQPQKAIDQVLGFFKESLAALTNKAHLHPKGNPVYLRPLAPLMVMYQWLDHDCQLTDTQRHDGACLIAQLSDLLLRRDFYPWHTAMLKADAPQSVDGLYRGMLNQNFNTDRYVAVGMAGCVLPSHPHATRWRRHAIDQFKLQMSSFVYPGGAWEESHTYANHVKLTLLPLGMALQQTPEAFNMFTNANFTAMCRFFVPLLSPPEIVNNGRRAIPALGDHHYDPESYSFLFLAGLAMFSPQIVMIIFGHGIRRDKARPEKIHYSKRCFSPCFVQRQRPI